MAIACRANYNGRVLSASRRNTYTLTARLPLDEPELARTNRETAIKDRETLLSVLRSITIPGREGVAEDEDFQGYYCRIGIKEFLGKKFQNEYFNCTGETLLITFFSSDILDRKRIGSWERANVRTSGNLRKLLEYAWPELRERHFNPTNAEHLQQVLKTAKRKVEGLVDGVPETRWETIGGEKLAEFYMSVKLHDFTELRFDNELFSLSGDVLLRRYGNGKRRVDNLDQLLKDAGYERDSRWFDFSDRQNLRDLLGSCKCTYEGIRLSEFRKKRFNTLVFECTADTLLLNFGAGEISVENLRSLLRYANEEHKTDQESLRQAKIADFWIKHGWYERTSYKNTNAIFVPTEGYVRLCRGEWSGETMREATKCLVDEVLEGRIPTVKDFRRYKLGYVIATYRDSTPLALFDAGIMDRAQLEKHVLVIDTENPKGMEAFFLGKDWCIPGGNFGLGEHEAVFLAARWDTQEVRLEAFRFMLEVVFGMDTYAFKDGDLRLEDVHANHLGSMLIKYYGNCQHLALFHAGWIDRDTLSGRVRIIDKLAPKGMEAFFLRKGWYVEGSAVGLEEHEAVFLAARWGDRQTNLEAIEFLVEEVLKKDPEEVQYSDFIEHGLKTLVNDHYRCSNTKAIRDVYQRIKPWEMKTAPMGFYMKRGNRIRVAKWFAKQMMMPANVPGKKVVGEVGHAREITARHISENGYSSLLKALGSTFDVLFEAGLVTREDEPYMRSNRHGQDTKNK